MWLPRDGGSQATHRVCNGKNHSEVGAHRVQRRKLCADTPRLPRTLTLGDCAEDSQAVV